MATAARSARVNRRRKGGSGWAAWIPFILGIVMTPVALRAASILALSGPGGMTLLYPFVQILQNPLLHGANGLADPVAQGIMYLQFPIYGLIMARIIPSMPRFPKPPGTVSFSMRVIIGFHSGSCRWSLQ